jgi:predicted HicB family RNase H-like nuclease
MSVNNLTYKADMYYNISMKQSKSKPNMSIRIDPEILHKAKVAAVTAKKTLGEWLEQAIIEKISREDRITK